jgi:hypothetical protein
LLNVKIEEKRYAWDRCKFKALLIYSILSYYCVQRRRTFPNRDVTTGCSVVSSNEVNVLHSLLYLSTIFEKSACNKVNFFWSTFTWNEVVLRSNVLTFYFVIFILWRSISLLSNFCLILRDLFLIYFNFGVGNTTSIFVWNSRLWLTYKHYLFNGFLISSTGSGK